MPGDEARPALEPGRTFGRYRILRGLGSGAMGTVYLAEDTHLRRQVALKTPHIENDPGGSMLARFRREAQACAALRHANVCPIHDVGEIAGQHYISMAYIEGRPLSTLIRDKPQGQRQTLIALHKLAPALQEAHDRGIVHRDLKPANIMVDHRGEPIVMDFGLARQFRGDSDTRITQSGMLIGTPKVLKPIAEFCRRFVESISGRCRINPGILYVNVFEGSGCVEIGRVSG